MFSMSYKEVISQGLIPLGGIWGFFAYIWKDAGKIVQ